ncbi:MAG: hypothetical protein OEX02_07310 [Cyclobacteriaceae bacterium]|nr:hypothetical protein [Cyclobacteriaceae bacterium]
MGRNSIYILLLLTGLFPACEEDETFFEGPFHVRFTEEIIQELESNTAVIPVSVHLVGPQRGENIRISYSISGDAREGVDYEIVGDRGIVVIPRNESFGFIDVKLINNSNNILEKHNIVFNLESVKPTDLDIGFGSGVKAGKEMTFTIIDDCILGGSYTGTHEINDPPVEGIRISSTDCIKYRLENWDISIFSFPDVRDLFFTDNGDNTLNIPEQDEETLPTEFATIRGNGVVNPVTREITFNIELMDIEGSPVVTLKYIPE